MLEKITNTITDVVRTVSGKATISEKNIDEYVEKTSYYSERIKEQYRVIVLNQV